MSDVVRVVYPEATIAEIILEDRKSCNTFSYEFIQGIINAFSSLLPETKVVVVHGYENYFCCGGTQEELLKIFEGKITFADLDFFKLLLECPVPTIAAMQGHALGGGLAFGAYADLIIMAEECLYSANFMKYGFTPGMGSTYIVPRKLGEQLGNEMLYSAKNYHGGELKQRGALVPIVKKKDVIDTAFNMAKEIAEKPLISLKILKKHLVANIVHDLPAIIKQELEMHEISFKLPEVKERIQTLFGK